MSSTHAVGDPFAALLAMEQSCNPSAEGVSQESVFRLFEPTLNQALIFEVNGTLWALPLHWIREVVRQPRLTRIPNSAKELQGLVNLRGVLAPVLDLVALLGLSGPSTTPAVVICLQQGRQIVGLGAQRILGMRRMAGGLQSIAPKQPWNNSVAWHGALAWQPGLWAGVPDWASLLASSGEQVPGQPS